MAELFQRISYMSDHALLNLLDEQENRANLRGLLSILSLFAACLVNYIIQEHEY